MGDSLHKNVCKRGRSLAVGRSNGLDTLNEVERQVGVLRKRENVVVEINRARGGYRNLFGSRLTVCDKTLIQRKASKISCRGVAQE